MSAVGEILRLLSVGSLALFAGAMLTEGCVLVPFWRSLAPADFLAWYRANDRRLLDFFSPLTSTTAVLALIGALISFLQEHSGRWLATAAAGLSLVVVSSFFVYFKSANASFSNASIPVDQVPAELARWARWHWLRTGVSFAAAGAGLLSV